MKATTQRLRQNNDIATSEVRKSLEGDDYIHTSAQPPKKYVDTTSDVTSSSEHLEIDLIKKDLQANAYEKMNMIYWTPL